MLIRPVPASFGFGFPLAPNSPPISDTGGSGGGDLPDLPDGFAFVVQNESYVVLSDQYVIQGL